MLYILYHTHQNSYLGQFKPAGESALLRAGPGRELPDGSFHPVSTPQCCLAFLITTSTWLFFTVSTGGCVSRPLSDPDCPAEAAFLGCNCLCRLPWCKDGNHLLEPDCVLSVTLETGHNRAWMEFSWFEMWSHTNRLSPQPFHCWSLSSQLLWLLFLCQ